MVHATVELLSVFYTVLATLFIISIVVNIISVVGRIVYLILAD